MFHSSSHVSTGGLLRTTAGFNVDNSTFNLNKGNVFIEQFDAHVFNLNYLNIRDGSFATEVSQMFNISHLEIFDGFFGGTTIFVDLLHFYGGSLLNHTTTTVNSLVFTDSGSKIFTEESLVVALNSAIWNQGHVNGENSSRLTIPTESFLNLIGTEGWFVPEQVEVNSAIYAEGPVTFSTSDSIIMQWDLFAEFISISNGVVTFDKNLVLVKDVAFAPETDIYLKGEFNVSDSIIGSGDIYIDDPNSLIAYNGIVDLSGVLYMKDGLLDLRLSTIRNITIEYTGGIILFREDIRGEIIRLPYVGIDLVIDDSILELVDIGICDAPITVKNSVIDRFLVGTMTDKCILKFLEYAIVAELKIGHMNGGELVFGSDSDVKLDSITLNDGLIKAEINSSPSFSKVN
ncbi:hypothetical protein GEMRC1_014175 [Eukaryota sp. GEM-RC1]